MKKLIGIILIIGLFVTTTLNSGVKAVTNEEFASNESHYRSLCSSSTSSDNREVCLQYQSYLNQKMSDQQAKLNEISSQLEQVQSDISKYNDELQKQIEIARNAEKDLASLNEMIDNLNKNIEQLDQEITTRKAAIEKLNTEIKNRVAAQQVTLHRNEMVDFIFGTSSLTEMSRNIYVVNKVTERDKREINNFVEQKAALEKDQQLATEQKKVQEEARVKVEALKESAEKAQEDARKVISAYQAKEAEIQAAEEEAQLSQKASAADLELIRTSANRVDSGGGSSVSTGSGSYGYSTGNSGAGWIYPVDGSFIVTAGAFYYPADFGGGVHLGVDLASWSSRPIVSAGNGVVVATHSSCPNSGYLGNSCGGYFGNYVSTIISKDGKLYGLVYAHLRTVNVSVGDTVSTGSVVGYMGNSGSSTGMHLHHEVYSLGSMSIQEYMNQWDGNRAFVARGLATNCENKGSTPCRENPQHWYGFVVDASY